MSVSKRYFGHKVQYVLNRYKINLEEFIAIISLIDDTIGTGHKWYEVKESEELDGGFLLLLEFVFQKKELMDIIRELKSGVVYKTKELPINNSTKMANRIKIIYQNIK
jgi:hypothetical protein